MDGVCDVKRPPLAHKQTGIGADPFPVPDRVNANRRWAKPESKSRVGENSLAAPGEDHLPRSASQPSCVEGPTSLARVLGTAFILVGVAGDALAGVAILQGGTLVGLGLHLPAALIWIAGMVLLRSRRGSPRRPATPPSDLSVEEDPTDPLADRSVPNSLALLLGLVLFPGLGLTAFTLALATSPLFRRSLITAAGVPDEPETDDARLQSWSDGARMRDGLGAGSGPLTELLGSSDRDAKHLALQRIVREPGSRSISLARRLLADPDPDVRALAALAVSRLESSLSEALRQGLLRCQAHPEQAGPHADLGKLFLHWSEKDGAHPTQRRVYLRRAREELETAVSLEPTRMENLLTLAQVLVALQEDEQASDTLEKAFAGGQDSLEGYVLAMEIALRGRRFDRLGDLAEQALPLAYDGETPALLRWWIPLQSGQGSRAS